MSWIQDYEDLYKIYQNGEVESYHSKNPRILKHCIDSVGYKKVTLCKNNKRTTFRIHRLIALHFIENPNDYSVIDHIDRDRQNNNLENLRWTTHSINCRNRTNFGECMQGVTKSKNGKKFVARIWVDEKKIYLGTFDTELEAHNCFKKENNKIIEDFNNL
tara:strand:+ start:125 stop:604 length:480 start_codon:yes stop_codon:yes gene_type:complete